jgi:hypothetical protein
MIAATPWLDNVLGPLAAATAQIERRYAGTVVESEARSRYAALGEDLDELCHGRIRRPRDDYEYLLRSTRECGRILHAVTNVLAERPGGRVDWWSSGIGRDYWQANLDAIGRGVRISRIFIYTELTAQLVELAAAQEAGGVQVGLAEAGGLDPEMLHNLAIWDDSSAWEAKLNAGGEIVGNTFTINEADVARLNRIFQFCQRAGRVGPHRAATPRNFSGEP